MSKQRVKTWIEYVGSALALLVGCWALYLEIASDGNDPTVIRWFAAATALAFATAAAAWLIGKLGVGQPQSPPSAKHRRS